MMAQIYIKLLGTRCEPQPAIVNPPLMLNTWPVA
jgi:hypothetical protein